MREKDLYPIRKTSYEEIENKKLQEFYVVIQVTSVEILLGETPVLNKSRVYMIYGIDIMGRKNIIGLYVEDENNSRYWLDQMEKIKQRGLKKILYVSTEKNKRLEQAFKIVYNPIMKISISEDVEKIAKYTQYKWKSNGERELVDAYLAETEEEYIKKKEEIKEKYKNNQIGTVLIREFEKYAEKEQNEPKEIRHLICSYSTKRRLKEMLNKLEKEYEEVRDLEDLFEKEKEYFTMFEKTRIYSKKRWTEILNKLYETKYEEIKEYV